MLLYYSLLIVCSSIANSLIPILKPVSYQVHSWNDLFLWPNGFKQGMKGMKIDAHFIENQSFCANQHQVTSNSTNGCFVLTHDNPVSTRQYNSTDNIIQFITNNINLFNSKTNPIFLAICFKLSNANPCDNSPTATKWRYTATSLMNSLTEIINKYKLTLEIILDGTGADANIQQNECLAHLWMPYMKTFTGSPSNPIATSNNQTLGYDRFSILDTSVQDNEQHCIDSFNNWVTVGFEKYNNTQQPWLWWEPSSQDCIQQLTVAYNNSQFIHQFGFYFAINVDIQRFKVYSGYDTWNEPLKLKDSSDSTGYSQIITSFVDSIGHIVVVTVASRNNEIVYNIGTASSVVANDLNILQWKVLTNTGLDAMELTSVGIVDNGTDMCMSLSSQNGIISVLTMDKTSLKINNVLNGKFIPGVCGLNGNVEISSIFMQWNDKSLLISQIFVCNSNTFGIQKWLQNDTAVNRFSEYGTPILIKQFANIQDISDVSIVVSNVLNIVVWSVNKKIYGGWGSVSIENIMQIGVGDKPRLSMNNYNNMIIMVHQNAYCWICQKHLKQPKPATCSANPISMKGVLAYSVGSLNEWENKFRYNDGMISVCDKYLIHGMYDGGFNPYSTIVVDGNDNIGIISVHDGISDLVGYTDLKSCGAPITYNDLVLDSWMINKY